MAFVRKYFFERLNSFCWLALLLEERGRDEVKNKCLQ